MQSSTPPTYDEARAASIKCIESIPITVAINASYSAVRKALAASEKLRGVIPEENRRAITTILGLVERSASSQRFELMKTLMPIDD